MVTEKPDKSLTISSTAVDNGPAQNSVVEAVLNGVENGGNSLTNDVSTENGTLSNSDRQPGEWESFEVHYVGRGISTIQATNGHESDSSFVSDSDDDQYDGYEPITMQTLQAHTSDFTNSEEDIFDGVVSENENIDEPPATTPRAENRLFATAVPTYQQNGTHTTSKDGLDTRAYSNDIPLDKDRIAEITAAMSGFVLPPYASMPDDAKLLEMVQKITQS